MKLCEMTVVLSCDIAGNYTTTFKVVGDELQVDHAQIIASSLVAQVAVSCNEGWDAGVESIVNEARKMRKVGA